jgi:SAM-dependent methyltransferase
MTDCTYRLHTEKQIDGFTANDGTVRFYCFVQATILKTGARHILDFGAGRGSAFHDDNSRFRRHIRDLRTLGAKVTACDVDNSVHAHPASHVQVVVKPDEKLPFPDDSFDVVVSDMTFEHIGNETFVTAELLRVTRPGGMICARTPNRAGYVRLVTALVPGKLQTRLLARAQPERKAEDVFPTVYRINSPSQVRRLFSGCKINYYYDQAEPAYYFGNLIIYRLFCVAHKLIPLSLSTGLCLFIEKPLVAD